MKAYFASALLMAVATAQTPATAAPDQLSQARMAAIDGDHGKCAQLADKARRQKTAVWQAHHVYATCQIYATEARKDKISKSEYADGINKAVDALKFILDTPDILVNEEHRASVLFLINEMDKRITARSGE
ncbi:MAG: hypothetical protein K0U74_14135 [Alphaproteobacteria bacterium]|nr:hypothetical protein [Alphaproteobacteria bacterium]